MLTESFIEKSIEQLQGSEELVLPANCFSASVQSYIYSEIMPNLLEDEKGICLFCLSVLGKTMHDHNGFVFSDVDQYVEAEENNWSIRDKNQKWNDALDIYFNAYPEEDLLAFVEDMLIDDDDQSLSLVGKEIIFVSCKSLIDVYISETV